MKCPWCGVNYPIGNPDVGVASHFCAARPGQVAAEPRPDDLPPGMVNADEFVRSTVSPGRFYTVASEHGADSVVCKACGAQFPAGASVEHVCRLPLAYGAPERWEYVRCRDTVDELTTMGDLGFRVVPGSLDAVGDRQGDRWWLMERRQR